MKWKCKQSGNVIDLPDTEEENMLGHDGYEKVEEDKQVEDKKSTVASKKAKE